MKNLLKSYLHQVLTVGLIVGFLTATPAQAAPDDFITPNDGTCDLIEADLGLGTALDPFQLGTMLQVAEIDDCDNERSVSYTAASSNGSVVTYTADHNFGVGQEIRITNSNEAAFNFDFAVISAVTENTFSIRSNRTLTTATSGDVKATMTHFKLVNDIDLSQKREGVNEPDKVVVTGMSASGDNQLLIQGSNTLDIGQTVYLDGFNPVSYNYKTGTVIDADANSFVVDIPFDEAYVSGGTVYGKGWTPLDVSNSDSSIELDGAGFTISNMSIYSPEQGFGLFSYLGESEIRNLKIEDFVIDAKTDVTISSVGLLAGYIVQTVIANVEVSGSISTSGNDIGLLVGYVEDSNINDIKVVGRIDAAEGVNNSVSIRRVGGAVGNGNDLNLTKVEADVDIDSQSLYQGRLYTGTALGSVLGNGYGTVSQIEAQGTVVGGSGVGGVIGYFCCGDISYIDSAVDVIAKSESASIDNVGGLIGDFSCCGAIREINVTGDVTIEAGDEVVEIDHIGGAVGSNDCCSTLTGISVENTIDITAISDSTVVEYVGGVVGYSAPEVNTERISFVGEINVKNGFAVGGIMGYADEAGQHISDAFVKADINISGVPSEEGDPVRGTGGIVGYALADLHINRVFFDGSITVSPLDPAGTTSSTGGILGYANDSGVYIQNSYALADIMSPDFAGGIVGKVNSGNMISVHNTYFVGDLDIREDLGYENVDPFTNGGSVNTTGSVFFNSNVSESRYGAISKTLNELKSKATFSAAGYEFDSEGPWRIAGGTNNGLPYLAIPVFGGGETIDRAAFGQSNKFNRISFGKVLDSGSRRYLVNLATKMAGKQVRINLLREGVNVKTLKVGKLNKVGNLAFKNGAKLQAGDVIRVKMAGKVISRLTVK